MANLVYQIFGSGSFGVPVSVVGVDAGLTTPPLCYLPSP